MDMSKEEYFFYEWLIIAKRMDEEKLGKLTKGEFQNLKIEFARLYIKTIK